MAQTDDRAQLLLRLPAHLKQRIQARAEYLGISANALVVTLLDRHVDEVATDER